MTAHELMTKTNHYLIKGGALNEKQRANIVAQLLAARGGERVVDSFKRGVRSPESTRTIFGSNDTRIIYPLFYVPPYDGGRKLQTVIPMSPKTHILSANAYELEILRLLHMFAPDNAEVREMVAATLARLRTTCFASQDCHVGECFHSGLVALRFIAAVTDDYAWMWRLVAFYNRYSGEKKRHSGVAWYFWLCLSELPHELAEPELRRWESEFKRHFADLGLGKGARDKELNEVLMCIVTKAISSLNGVA